MYSSFYLKMEYESKSAYTHDQVLSSLNCNIISESDESLSVHLINEVKKYPVLYDFNHEKYTDKECRAKIWNRISEDLGLSAKEAKRQWKRLRDSFRDALKRQDSKGGGNCKVQKVWRYQKKMEFVIPFMTIREAPSGAAKRKRNRNNNNAQNAAAASSSTAPSTTVDTLLGTAGATALMSKAFLAQSGNGAGFGSMPFNLLAEGTRHGYGPMANPYGRDGHCGPQQRSLNAIGEGACSYYTQTHEERQNGSAGSTSTTSNTSSAGISFGSAMRYMRVEGFDTSVLEDLITKPLDDELYFCLSLAATMKRLSEQRRAKLKCDVMGLLYNAQYNEAFQ